VPFETRSPFQASGIRLGTPAITTRGFREEHMADVADFIDSVLAAIGTDRETAVIAETKKRVATLTAQFPLPYRL